MKTHYETLELLPGASEEQVRDSYIRLSKKYHPDLNSNGKDQFLAINLAYQVLSQPEKRRLYDTFGISNVNDSPWWFPTVREPVRVEITLEEYYHGCSKVIKVEVGRKCLVCGGSGEINRVIQQGNIVTLVKQKCECGKKEKKDITLYILPGMNISKPIPVEDVSFQVIVTEHDHFTLKGLDLYWKKTITLNEALTGTTFLIPHLEGDLRVTTREVIKPGSKWVIKGKGVHNQMGYEEGDLVIEFQVEFPDKVEKRLEMFLPEKPKCKEGGKVVEMERLF